jgi:hypothetical protein
MSEENINVSAMSDEELDKGVISNNETVEEVKSEEVAEGSSQEVVSEESGSEEKVVPTIEELQAQIEELKAANQKRISDKDRYIAELREKDKHRAEIIQSNQSELDALRTKLNESDTEFVTKEDLINQDQIRKLEQQNAILEKEAEQAAKVRVEALINETHDFEDLKSDMDAVLVQKRIPKSERDQFSKDPLSITRNEELLAEVIDLARIRKENREMKEKFEKFTSKEKSTLETIAKTSSQKALTNSSGQTSVPDSFTVPENWRTLSDEQFDALYNKQTKE